jgi:hypothetical protein
MRDVLARGGEFIGRVSENAAPGFVGRRPSAVRSDLRDTDRRAF